MVTSEWPSVHAPAEGVFIEQQVDALRRAGVEVEVKAFAGRHRPLRYLRIWRDIQRTIRRGDHDLVHAQFGHSGALAATPKRRPLVVTYRGSDILGGGGGPMARLFVAVSRYGARRADARIIVAAHMAPYLPAPPTAVIPSGLDRRVFHPEPQREARERLGLPLDKRLALFVENRPGRPEKRFWLAVESVRLVDDLELIHVSGMPRDAIADHMNAADVLLLTSSREGSPNVVKEALACGLPVVALDVGDVRERVADVEGCIVCEDERPETIAAAIRTVLSTPTRVHAEHVIGNLDEDLLTRDLITVYEGVLEGDAANR